MIISKKVKEKREEAKKSGNTQNGLDGRTLQDMNSTEFRKQMSEKKPGSSKTGDDKTRAGHVDSKILEANKTKENAGR